MLTTHELRRQLLVGVDDCGGVGEGCVALAIHSSLVKVEGPLRHPSGCLERGLGGCVQGEGLGEAGVVVFEGGGRDGGVC